MRSNAAVGGPYDVWHWHSHCLQSQDSLHTIKQADLRCAVGWTERINSDYCIYTVIPHNSIRVHKLHMYIVQALVSVSYV